MEAQEDTNEGCSLRYSIKIGFKDKEARIFRCFYSSPWMLLDFLRQ